MLKSINPAHVTNIRHLCHIELKVNKLNLTKVWVNKKFYRYNI